MFTSIYDEPSGTMPLAASPIVQAAIDSLDHVNDEIEREVAKASLTRHALGNLIERLIAQLDDAEPDPDLEASFGWVAQGHVDEAEFEDEGGDILDEGHDGELDVGECDGDVDGELTACEATGQGFGLNGGFAGTDDDEDGGDREQDFAELGIGDIDGLEDIMGHHRSSGLEFDGMGKLDARRLLRRIGHAAPPPRVSIAASLRR